MRTTCWLDWSDPEQGLKPQLMVPERGHTVPVQFLQTEVVCEARFLIDNGYLHDGSRLVLSLFTFSLPIIPGVSLHHALLPSSPLFLILPSFLPAVTFSFHLVSSSTLRPSFFIAHRFSSSVHHSVFLPPLRGNGKSDISYLVKRERWKEKQRR